jgi:cation transport ATPase
MIGGRTATLRVEPHLRAAIYAVVALLFITGAAWLAMDQGTDAFAPDAGWGQVSAALLAAHGGFAMAFLLLLGALVALHVQSAWRSRRNRVIGATMLVANATLILTAFGLYYLGSETLRRWTSDVHIAVGLGFPAILAIHVFLGRRSRRVE